jgi:hypothetical protein
VALSFTSINQSINQSIHPLIDLLIHQFVSVKVQIFDLYLLKSDPNKELRNKLKYDQKSHLHNESSSD